MARKSNVAADRAKVAKARKELFKGKKSSKAKAQVEESDVDVAVLDEEALDEVAADEFAAVTEGLDEEPKGKKGKAKKGEAKEEEEELEEILSDEDLVNLYGVEIPEPTPGTLKMSQINLNPDFLAKQNKVRWGTKSAMQFDLNTEESKRLEAAIRIDGRINEPIGVHLPKGKKLYEPIFGITRAYFGSQIGLTSVAVQKYPTLNEEQVKTLQLQENSLAGNKRKLSWGKIAEAIDDLVGGPNAEISSQQMEYISKRFGYEKGTIGHIRRAYRILPAVGRKEANLDRLSYQDVNSLLRVKDEDKNDTCKYSSQELSEILNRAGTTETEGGKVVKTPKIKRDALATACHEVEAENKQKFGKPSTPPHTVKPSSAQVRDVARWFMSQGSKLTKLALTTSVKAAKAAYKDEDLLDSPSLHIAAGMLLSIGDLPFPKTTRDRELAELREDMPTLLKKHLIIGIARELIIEADFLALNRKGDEVVPFMDGTLTIALKKGEKKEEASKWIESMAAALMKKTPELNGVKCDTIATKALLIAKHASRYAYKDIETEDDE